MVCSARREGRVAALAAPRTMDILHSRAGG